MPGSILIEIILWLCFLVPGFIYTIWRHSSTKQVCGTCGSKDVIPVDSPLAKKMAQGGLAPSSTSEKSNIDWTEDIRRKGPGFRQFVKYALGFLFFIFIVSNLNSKSTTKTTSENAKSDSKISASGKSPSAEVEPNNRTISSNNACGWYLHYEDGSGECECANETPADVIKDGARILSQNMGADKKPTKVILAQMTKYSGMFFELKMLYFRDEKECRVSLEKILTKKRKDDAVEKKNEELRDKNLEPYT
jgi:hypothetical protein